MNASELTLWPYYWRATSLFGEKEIVSRTTSGVSRYTYEDFGDRVARLANALVDMGVGQGTRVGTVGWNHHRHLEAYYAVPLVGAQLHTINAMLSDDDTAYIIDDADDDVLLVDPGEPAATLERIWDDIPGSPTVVVMDETTPDLDIDGDVVDFESLIRHADPIEEWPAISEDLPAGMCYTSGTTGRPKGVEYTQKMIYNHAMMTMTPAALDISERDVVMPVVPMFHVNSWEFPYAVTMAGAKQVYPGPSPSSADLATLIEAENVTLTAGVPTVWIDLLEYLAEHDVDISSLDRIIVGGSAAPKGVMRRFYEEYDVVMEQAWGMTETMSIGSLSRPKSNLLDSDADTEYDLRAKQGLLSPGLEMRIVQDGEDVPWDGESAGELWVRGPTVVDEYYNCPQANEEDFEDGWLKTGDIAVVDEDGYLEIIDRVKDVIKSGGEWISSIELENALMAHDEVSEAAVISVPHDRWQERPFACVVLKPDATVHKRKLRESLEAQFERWQLPDNIVVVDEIPKTATGKFDKKTLRSNFDDPDLPWTPGS
jgi:fatty-acyl-CoA synthase